MDFRTEWSSWAMVALMMLMSHFMAQDFQTGFAYLFQLIAFPFLLIAFSTIPVLIFCYFRKIEPDIDYSMRLAFVIMLVIFGLQFISPNF